MNKKNVACIASVVAVLLGAYAIYDKKDIEASEQQDMMMENVIALSSSETDNTGMITIRGSIMGYCWKKDIGKSNCPTPKEHGKGCQLVSVTFSSTPRPLYRKGYVSKKDFAKGNFVRWKQGDDTCDPNAGHRTTTNTRPSNPATYHTYGE